mgnify:CR=1 FL=1
MVSMRSIFEYRWRDPYRVIGLCGMLHNFDCQCTEGRESRMETACCSGVIACNYIY